MKLRATGCGRTTPREYQADLSPPRLLSVRLRRRFRWRAIVSVSTSQTGDTTLVMVASIESCFCFDSGYFSQILSNARENASRKASCSRFPGARRSGAGYDCKHPAWLRRVRMRHRQKNVSAPQDLRSARRKTERLCPPRTQAGLLNGARRRLAHIPRKQGKHALPPVAVELKE